MTTLSRIIYRRRFLVPKTTSEKIGTYLVGLLDKFIQKMAM